MKKLLLFCLSVLVIASSFAQLHDNIWLFGYDNNPDTLDPYGITVMNFKGNERWIYQNTKPDVNFDCTNTSYADSSGRLLMYTNGVHIYNSNDIIMEGGHS